MGVRPGLAEDHQGGTVVSLHRDKIYRVGDVMAWTQDNGEGRFRVSRFRNVAGHIIVEEVTFSDADTAFWFKMRFG